MVTKGKMNFDAKCLACHKTHKKFIGPAPVGILDRRSPEWVMNMILNPSEMVQKDPIARQLLIDHNGSPMADQGLTEEEARQILEYFRTLK
jgi:mono/diheme cytochrome c family protein